MSSDTKGYAHPEALVSTAWVAEHLHDPSVRLVESNEDILLYDVGHIPGAVKVDWHADLNDSLMRDYVDKAQFEALLSRLGIGNDTTVVFYGDKNNWWATYAYLGLPALRPHQRQADGRRPHEVGGRRPRADP